MAAGQGEGQVTGIFENGELDAAELVREGAGATLPVAWDRGLGVTSFFRCGARAVAEAAQVVPPTRRRRQPVARPDVRELP